MQIDKMTVECIHEDFPNENVDANCSWFTVDKGYLQIDKNSLESKLRGFSRIC